MGRKKVILTENQQKRRKLSGQRIKELRKSLGLTQIDLADRLEVTESTIRNYESGRSPLPEEYFSRLSIMSNGEYCAAYLAGESNIKTKSDYEKYCNENEDWPDPDEESRGQLLKEKEQQKALFLACGYKYAAKGMAAYDFLEIDSGNETPKEANFLEPVDASGPTIYFSDSEIAELIAELKDHIAFACFKKINRL